MNEPIGMHRGHAFYGLPTRDVAGALTKALHAALEGYDTSQVRAVWGHIADEAALNGSGVHESDNRLRVILIDNWPGKFEPTADEDVQFVLDEYFFDLPAAAKALLVRLAVDGPDEGRCAEDNAQNIGWGLDGPADEHSNWKPTTLVMVDGDDSNVYAVCEEHAPYAPGIVERRLWAGNL